MIKVQSKIHQGICSAHGGGQVLTYRTWDTGPINLLRAVRYLRGHSYEMDQGYGNVGHVWSRIVVDGIPLDWYDMTALVAQPTMETAREMLAAIRRVAQSREQAQHV